MSEPIKAEVFAWELHGPAVEYTFASGDRNAHRIGMDDWPILLRLERGGKLPAARGVCVHAVNAPAGSSCAP